MMKKKKKKLKEFIFTGVVWLVLLWMINFVCGLIVGNRYIAVDPINEKTAKGSFGYFAPLQKKIILFPGLKEYRVTINRLGLRSTGDDYDMTLADLKDKYRILTLGDSMTFGLFVDDEDSYPHRLQTLLNKTGKNAIVLNAGVGAAVMKDYLYYLKVKGLGLRPDLVAISFCENDLEGMDKAPLYGRMKKENVFSFGKTFKLAKFMRVFRKMELAYRYKRWLRKTKDERVRKILKTESKNIDDILYVAGYQAGKPALDPYHADLKEPWQKNFEVMDEIITLLHKEKIDVVFILYPNIITVFDHGWGKYQDILRDYFKKRNVAFIDILDEFKARKGEYLKLYNNLPRDFHLSGYGNQVLAEEFILWLQKTGRFTKIK